jgi:hypothetical protein
VPSLKVSFMKSLAQKCPVPNSKLPAVVKWPLWKEMPVSEVFLNVSSRVSMKELHPPRPPPQSFFRERERERETPSL